MSTVAAAPNTQFTMDPGLKSQKVKEGKEIYKYRLLRGRHIDRQGPFDPDDVSPSFPKGRYSLRTFQVDKRTETYPEFETHTDLSQPAYNPPGAVPKYTRVTEKAEPQVVLLDPTKRMSGETVVAYHARLAALMGEVKTQTDATMKSLDGMNLDQLREFADAEEIDWTESKTVDDLRKFVKSVLSGTTKSRDQVPAKK